MLQILILYILGPIIHGNVPLRHLSWERERSAFKASIGFLIYETLNQIGQNWKAYCFVDWDCPKINLTKLTCQKGQRYWRVESQKKSWKWKSVLILACILNNEPESQLSESKWVAVWGNCTLLLQRLKSTRIFLSSGVALNSATIYIHLPR